MLKVVLLNNLTNIIYVMAQAMTKDMLSSRGVEIYEIVFFRAFINVFLSFAYSRAKGLELTENITEDLYGYLWLRCASGVSCFLFLSWSIKYVPMGIC